MIEKVETETETDELIKIILRQTTYTEEEAEGKLKEHNYDAILVIKDFMGIKPKEQKPETVKSVNQEIYKQIRYKLDESMRQYTEKQNQKEKEKEKEDQNKK